MMPGSSSIPQDPRGPAALVLFGVGMHSLCHDGGGSLVLSCGSSAGRLHSEQGKAASEHSEQTPTLQLR